MEKYKLLLVGIGGFIGSISRFQINKIINIIYPSIEIGTLSVNIIGSFLIGIFSALITYNYLPNQLKFFIITGILGGLTTFSAFSLEVTTLLQNGKYNLALIFIILNVIESVLFTILGLLIIFYLKTYIK